MGEWVVKDDPEWMCTYKSNPFHTCPNRATWRESQTHRGACAKHAEAMGVPESLRNPQSTRTRIHVGWRVVRMREGKREWWNVGIGGWSRHPPSAGWREVSPNRDWVKSVGGRVVKVFLSYGKGG